MPDVRDTLHGVRSAWFNADVARASPAPPLYPRLRATLWLMSNPLSYLHDQLEQWRAEGVYQRLRILESESAAESRFDGKQVINLASNNYLGLTTHPKLREAAIEAVRKYGVGSGAVRTISGTMSLHMELEERIARFKNVEACVVFQSGFAASAGTVAAPINRRCAHRRTVDGSGKCAGSLQCGAACWAVSPAAMCSQDCCRQWRL